MRGAPVATRGRRMAFRVVVLLVPLALGASACDAGTNAGILPTVSTTTTVKPSDAAPPPPCKRDQLKAVFATTSAAAGTVAAGFVLTNLSEASCSLYGYPGITLVGLKGQPLSLKVITGGLSRPVRNTKPAKVVLSPHQSAQFTLQWNRAQGDCQRSTAIVVTPPGDTSGLRLSRRSPSGVPIDPCGSPPPPVVHISAVATERV